MDPSSVEQEAGVGLELVGWLSLLTPIKHVSTITLNSMARGVRLGVDEVLEQLWKQK
jgi:hypothetical protein